METKTLLRREDHRRTTVENRRKLKFNLILRSKLTGNNKKKQNRFL